MISRAISPVDGDGDSACIVIVVDDVFSGRTSVGSESIRNGLRAVL